MAETFPVNCKIMYLLGCFCIVIISLVEVVISEVILFCR